jgi:NAD(P)-dependent dehydrogenase (short-subunit alcohol dehydrogenase family)
MMRQIRLAAPTTMPTSGGINPMGKFAMPDDIARAVLFLADPTQSGFIDGEAFAVDGGWTVDGTWQSLRMRKR